MMIEKHRAKKSTLDTQITKTESSIKRKEVMGDDLKFIDFHQLQIENKKYMKEIDEKNNKFIDLKKATGKIITELTKKRKALIELIQNSKKLEEDILTQKKQIAKTQKDHQETSDQKEEEFNEYKRYQQQFEQLKNMPNKAPYVPEYATLKKNIQNLEYSIKNLKRKKEIAKFQYREAMKYFKNQSQQV